MKKIIILPIVLLIACCNLCGQITTLNCAPNVTISNSPLVCTGTTLLKGPSVSYSNPYASGNALNFDGVNDYVSLGTSTLFNITSAISIEAWVKVTAFTTAWQAIVTKGDNSWRIQRNNLTNQISFGTTGLSNVDLAGTKNINDGQWHHIAAVYNGTTKFLYIDAVLDASIAATGSISVSTYAALIGENAQPVSSGRYFNGTIDEVRIWNSARTQAQIQANMGAELNIQSNLIASYHFNQGIAGDVNSGIVAATDASGNGLNGNLTNFANTGATSNWVNGCPFIGKVFGNALQLDGINDYAFLPNNLATNFTTGKVTAEAWVYMNAYTNWAGIIENWGNSSGAFQLSLNNATQKLNINITQANGSVVSVTAPNVFPLNNWVHVAFVADGTKVHLYQNGLEVGTAANYDGTLKTSFAYTNIGCKPGDTGGSDATNPGFLNGRLDEVRIWNIARSEAEIFANMYNELFVDTSLVVLYHCNQGAAGATNAAVTTLIDASGNNRTGTLNNIALSGSTSNWTSGQNFDVKISNNAPANFALGNTNVTWTATDGNAVNRTCIQTVTVVSPTGTQVLASNNVLIADGDATASVADLTDFGNAGSSRIFTIKNPSSTPLIIDNISLTGTNNNDFSATNITLPAAVAANGQITFSLNFAPISTGVKNATINIATNNCTIGNYDFAVKGTGVTVQSVVFNATGTYTPLPGVTSVVVQAWGSGANGGNTANAYNGGGGGGFLQTRPLTVSAPVTVGIASRQLGQNGVTTFFGGFGSPISANGTITSTGGAATTGPSIAFSYKGGDGGTCFTDTQNGGCGKGGGGGGAAGTSGNGSNGQSPTSSFGTANGGAAGSGGGLGGNGGYFNGSGCSIIGGTNPTSGDAPGGGGGAGLNRGTGGNGRVIVYYTCDPTPGTIGNAHSIPYPPQLAFDSILNIDGTAPTAENRLVYSWQIKTNSNPTWRPAKNSINNLSYRLDLDSLNENTYFRRVTNACGNVGYTDSILIRVINPPIGIIEGKVVSLNGTPISGITVYAQKLTALPGSPLSRRDSAITGVDGKYKMQRVYFGDPAENGGYIQTDFVVTPYLLAHNFQPASLVKTLSSLSPSISAVDFTDTTSLIVSGQTYQQCINCLDASNNITTISAPLDSVNMYRNNTFSTISGFIDPPAEYGRYGVSVINPGNYRIEPRFKNHKFLPTFKDTLVQNNVNNINFNDTSTNTISGYFSAGCNDYIGRAVLEFQDVLPNGQNNLPQIGLFRKRVTTDSLTGFFTVRLPARKYKISVISFSPIANPDVDTGDLLYFFNTTIKDSLVKNITENSASCNLVYKRPSTLQIFGLDPLCTGANAFAIFPQNEEKTFLVKVYQGAVSKNCPVTDTAINIITNITGTDALDTFTFTKVIPGTFQVKLTGASPNTIAPYSKFLKIEFTDSYGRTVSANPPVLVTGVKIDPGQAFTTVSPQVPLMVLHDPPGDASYSSWKKDSAVETAMRFYTTKNRTQNTWEDVKLGVAYTVGVGEFVTVASDFSTWGSIGQSLTVTGTNKKTSETILRSTSSQTFSTSNNAAVIGAKGDVFIGAAINLLYTSGREILFDPTTCTITNKKKLIMANNGFNTEFIYSENHIRNTIIPDLISQRDLATDSLVKANKSNQISVWEQTLKNNNDNKTRAAFVRNWSFDGAAGPYTNTTTSSSIKSNTIEFNTIIDQSIAFELGFEAAGSGVSTGYTSKLKIETGESKTSTVLASSTFEYQLDDDDNGDFYSVDVKKDPVYNSPVFELVGGRSSCPYEPGTQPRDQIQLACDNPSVSGIIPGGEAEFIIKLGNTSAASQTRTYNFSFDQSSNPGGAMVTIGGSPAVAAPIPYTVGYLSEVPIVVKVKQGLSNIFSYEGLRFLATDSCDGTVRKSIPISAFFQGTCGQVTLASPINNWIVNAAENNILPVVIQNYNLANVTSVELQYSVTNANSWNTGFIKTAAQLSVGINGTTVNWNVSSLPEGAFSLRLKLICATGTVYSERVSGIIDRKPPIVFGIPEPTDDNLIAGDQISMKYNEALNINNIDSNNVELFRLSDNVQLPADVIGYNNQLIVVPRSSILGYLNDSFRVVLQNIPDVYGNIKTLADTFRFTVGNRVIDTSSKSLKLSVRNNSLPENPIAAFQSFGNPILQSSTNQNSLLTVGDTTIAVYFDLKNNAINRTRVNFNISGTAVFGQDYNVIFDSVAVSFVNSFDGTTGSIAIENNTKRGILRIDPINNTMQNSNKTIVISALEGGDYGLGDTTVVTVSILNVPNKYEFIGSGNFSDVSNWLNAYKPTGTLNSGYEIIINPLPNGECVLDVPLIIMQGGKLTIVGGKKMRLLGNLQIN